MGNRSFIITGASKGIGMQLTQLLLEQGDRVYGISRGTAELLHGNDLYYHFQYDLSDLIRIEQLVKKILEQIPLQETEFIGLINNAAMLEPLKPIDQCSAEEISLNLNISLGAPMMLSSSFIRQTNHLSARRKIVNLTSGSGSYPAPSMAAYCTSKAGINMFSECLAREQSERLNPVEVIAFDPGMVDTELQAVARGKSIDEFALSGLFNQVYEAGQLKSPRDVAKRLIGRIEENSDTSKVIQTMEG